MASVVTGLVVMLVILVLTPVFELMPLDVLASIVIAFVLSMFVRKSCENNNNNIIIIIMQGIQQSKRTTTHFLTWPSVSLGFGAGLSRGHLPVQGAQV
jgi:MFS superfamily sulfate permease-like transporter